MDVISGGDRPGSVQRVAKKMVIAEEVAPLAPEERQHVDTRFGIASAMQPILHVARENVSDAKLLRLGYNRADLTLDQLASAIQYNRKHGIHQGLIGICLQYAFHKGIENKEPSLYPLVASVLERGFKIKPPIRSVFYGIEMRAAVHQKIASTFDDIFGDAPVIVTKYDGAHPFSASTLEEARLFGRNKKLPDALHGLHQADLFLGNKEEQRWVAASVKIQSNAMEWANAIGIALYPFEIREENKVQNYIERTQGHPAFHIPVACDKRFMAYFFSAFRIFRKMIEGGLEIPTSREFYLQAEMFLAEYLYRRRGDRVQDVIEGLANLVGSSLITTMHPLITDQSEVQVLAPLDLRTGGKVLPVPLFDHSPIVERVFLG